MGSPAAPIHELGIDLESATSGPAAVSKISVSASAARQCHGARAHHPGEPHHLVRLTWYVTSRDEYLANLADIGRTYREVIGRHFPAMAVVQVVALMEARAKVEIEATAVVPCQVQVRCRTVQILLDSASPDVH